MSTSPERKPRRRKKQEDELGRFQRLADSVKRKWQTGQWEAPPEPENRMVFFDFDRTLTVVHVFKSLAGWVDTQVGLIPVLGMVVKKPYALTEMGQLRRLSELGPAWIEQAFGGRTRINVLRQFLQGLIANGFRILCVTRGYIGVARQCLQAVGLIESFERVYGNVGAAYGERTEYDLETEAAKLPLELEHQLGRWDDGQWDSKNMVVSRYMQERHLGKEDIIFVDDDIEEVKVLRHACSTVHVTGNAGLSASHVRQILELLDQAEELWVEELLAAWNLIRDPLASKPFAIIVWNRKQIPVRVTRYLVMLEASFASCTNALRRVKMLLRA